LASALLVSALARGKDCGAGLACESWRRQKAKLKLANAKLRIKTLPQLLPVVLRVTLAFDAKQMLTE
jgi:hypothetical protein